MIRSDLLSRLAQLPPSTELRAAHVAALAEALLPAETVRQALAPGAAPDPRLDEAWLGTLMGISAQTIESWRTADEKQTVAPQGTTPAYRLQPVLDNLQSMLEREADDAERLATAFPMFAYEDGAQENFLASLDRTEDPTGFWLLRIAKPLDDDAAPGSLAFLDALRSDPDAALKIAGGMPGKTLDSFNPANWFLAELCRPAARVADLAVLADALVLLNDHDLGLGINAYGAADLVRHGLHTRLSFTISHLAAGLTQSDRILAGTLSGYTALVMTLIKLGADFSLKNEQDQHVLDVATQVRKAYVSSPFLNIIDKFLLVQQLDEILLHGDDENAEKI